MPLSVDALLGAYKADGYTAPGERIGDVRTSLKSQLDSLELSTKKGIKKGFGFLAAFQEKLSELGKEGVKKFYSLQQEALGIIEQQHSVQRESALKEVKHLIKNTTGEITSVTFDGNKLIPDACKAKAVDIGSKRAALAEAIKTAEKEGTEASKKAVKVAKKAYKEAVKAFEDAFDGTLKQNETYKAIKSNIVKTEKYAKSHKIELPENIATATSKAAGKSTKAVGKKGKGIIDTVKRNWKITGGVAAGVAGIWVLSKLFGGSAKVQQ